MKVKVIEDISRNNLYFDDSVYIQKKITNRKERNAILEAMTPVDIETIDGNENTTSNGYEEYHMIKYYRDISINQLKRNKKAEIMNSVLSNMGEDDCEKSVEEETEEIENVLKTLIPSDIVIVFSYSGVSGNYINTDFFSIVYIITDTGINLGFLVPKAIGALLFKKSV